MMPAQYLRVFKFYLHVMRALAAEYDVCGTQIYSALLTDTAISIWNSPVGYGNVISTGQLPMF
jgi:hypothetical protein